MGQLLLAIDKVHKVPHRALDCRPGLGGLIYIIMYHKSTFPNEYLFKPYELILFIIHFPVPVVIYTLLLYW